MFYNIFLFLIIPIGLPVFFSILGARHDSRKYLWISPIAVLGLVALLSFIFIPGFFTGLFEELFGIYRDASRWRSYRMTFSIPFLISVTVVIICHIINCVRAQNKETI